MKTKRIKHIIWDWNGTLINDAWLFVELMNEELNDRGLPIININEYKQNFTFPVKKYYENLGFNFKTEDFKEVGYNFIQKYKLRKNEPQLYPETKLILERILNRGISQSIISAQENNLLKESIQFYQLNGFFNSIKGIDNYYADNKIEIAQKNRQQIKCHSTEIMMVGDTVHDYEVAQNLGIQCILFAGGHYTKKRLQKTKANIINNLLEVEQYL